MREIFLFLKYGLFFQVSGARKKKSNSKVGMVIAQLGAFLYFATFTTFVMVKGFSQAAGTVLGDVDLLRLTALYWMLMSGGFFLIGTIGSAIYVLSMNEEMEFLLALPLRRWTITFYQIFISLFYDLPVFGMLLAVSLAYGIVKGGFYPAIAVISAILHGLSLLTIGIFISTFIAKRLQASIARRIFILIQGVTIIGFVLLVNSYLESSGGYVQVIQRLQNLYGLLKNPLNVFGYAINAVDSPVYLLYSLGVAGLFAWLFVREARSIGFVVVKKGSGKVRFRSGKRSGGILQKDLRAIFRAENSLFLLLYPYIFGAFMGWTSKDPVYALLIALPISTLYVMMEAAIATASEMVAWDLTKSLPVKSSEFFIGKVIVPVGINFLLALALVIFSSFFKGFSWLVFPLLGLAILQHSTSALGGLYNVISNPPKSENIPRESMRGPVWMTFLIVGLSGGALMGIAAFSKWWGKLALIASIGVTIYLFIFFYRKTVSAFEKLMRGIL